MKILSLDPALATGWAHSSGRHGVWRLSVNGSEHAGARLARLEQHLRRTTAVHSAGLIVFEGSRQFTRGKAALAMHCELTGVIKKFAYELGVPFREYSPGEVKAFAGDGGYSKTEMIRALKIKLGISVRDDNEADACWLLALAQSDQQEREKRRRERVTTTRREPEPMLF